MERHATGRAAIAGHDAFCLDNEANGPSGSIDSEPALQTLGVSEGVNEYVAGRRHGDSEAIASGAARAIDSGTVATAAGDSEQSTADQEGQ